MVTQPITASLPYPHQPSSEVGGCGIMSPTLHTSLFHRLSLPALASRCRKQTRCCTSLIRLGRNGDVLQQRRTMHRTHGSAQYKIPATNHHQNPASSEILKGSLQGALLRDRRSSSAEYVPCYGMGLHKVWVGQVETVGYGWLAGWLATCLT
ncbi:hypothetical protein M426DRAFT_222221 [Hypoxylon sp. CI-4A]|nr:hypothetical protein M426DRAFT_222221 [Hypoxylon sp. CI-4A]